MYGCPATTLEIALRYSHATLVTKSITTLLRSFLGPNMITKIFLCFLLADYQILNSHCGLAVEAQRRSRLLKRITTINGQSAHWQSPLNCRADCMQVRQLTVTISRSKDSLASPTFACCADVFPAS